MVMEELYDIVDSIADLTVEDVKRHLSNRFWLSIIKQVLIAKYISTIPRSPISFLKRAVSCMLVLMAVFSESSSGGDAEENIVACDDTVTAAGDNHDNRHRIIKEDNKKENAEKGQIDDHSNPAKGNMGKENFEEIKFDMRPEYWIYRLDAM